jgi:hypothetical protein
VSSDFYWLGALILGAMISGWALAAFVVWIVTEWDEYKWRRRLSRIEFEETELFRE